MNFTKGAYLFALTVFMGGAPVMASDPTSAAEVNIRGYRLYKRKDYRGAITLFQQAISLDPSNSKYHYNLACSWSLASADCKFPRHIALDALERAVQLDPSRREKTRTDRDLIHLRDTVRYQFVMGLSPMTTSDVKTILTNVSWYAPTMPNAEFDHPAMGLDFKADGTVLLLYTSGYVHYEIPAEGKHILGQDHSNPFAKGRYQVDGKRVVIMFDEPISIWSDSSKINEWQGELVKSSAAKKMSGGDWSERGPNDYSILFHTPIHVFEDNSYSVGCGSSE